MGFNITSEACNTCGCVCDFDCDTGTIYCQNCGAHSMEEPWMTGGGIKQPGSGLGSWSVKGGYASKAVGWNQKPNPKENLC